MTTMHLRSRHRRVTAVGAGRPYAYTLPAAPQLRTVLAELDLTMAIDGYRKHGGSPWRRRVPTFQIAVPDGAVRVLRRHEQSA
jgi:hypothetical protein